MWGHRKRVIAWDRNHPFLVCILCAGIGSWNQKQPSPWTDVLGSDTCLDCCTGFRSVFHGVAAIAFEQQGQEEMELF
jgi:hypothetical protein